MMIKKGFLIITFCFAALGFIFVPYCYAFTGTLPKIEPKRSSIVKVKNNIKKNVEEFENSGSWQEFKKIYGDGWKARWNEKTGIPHRVFGNEKQVSAAGVTGGVLKRVTSGPLAESDFENISRVFITQNQGLFKIDNSALRLQRSRKHGSVWYTTFKQFYNGIPVYNSKVDFQFDGEGNLLLFGADAYPAINISNLQKYNEADVIEIAKNDIKFDPAKDKIGNPELLVYPEDVEGGYKYYLVWRVTVNIKKPAGDWIYFIDAGNGDIKHKYNDIKKSISGTISGSILPAYYNSIPQLVSFPYESVFAGVYGSTSAKDGNYSVSTSSGTYTLTSSLKGKYLNVTDENGDGFMFFASVNNGGTKNIVWDTSYSAFGYDEMNVYYHAMKMHDYIKSIDPNFSAMDYCVPAYVHLTDINDINNAYWSNSSGLHFGAGDGTNSRDWALFADVIYHEYTHGVNGKLYIQESGDPLDYTNGTESGAMEEGFADYWACTLTDESLLGEGVIIGEESLRDLNNNLAFPGDWNGEVHDDGRIISGAMWRVREQLGKDAADHLFHFARYGLPTTFEDFFMEVLMKDDDNNNLGDGTPNSSKIYSAITNSGISGLKIGAVSIDDKDGGNDNAKINPGERLNILVTLKNDMFENAENVKAILSTNDVFTDITSNQADFGTINEGGIGEGSFTLVLNNSTPANFSIPFNLKVDTGRGYVFDLSFTIKVSDFTEKKWRVEDITEVNKIYFSGNRTLDLDQNGKLHLLYRDNSLYYGFYDGDKWDLKILDDTKNAYSPALMLDKNSVPHIVLSDYGDNSLKYARLINGNWEREVVDLTADSYTQNIYTSLAFDSSNKPHISYSQFSSNAYLGILKHAYNDGQGWNKEVVDSYSNALLSSIDVPKDNHIRVIYTDTYGYLNYARKDGSNWVKGWFDWSSEFPAFKGDSDSHSNIFYYYYYKYMDEYKGKLKHIYWDGDSWESRVVDLGGDIGLYPSFVLDGADHPHVAYYDNDNGALKYAYYNGNFWDIETIDDSGDAGYCPSIVLINNRLPQIVYYAKDTDGTNKLKFASSSIMSSPVSLEPENNSFADMDVVLKWKLDNVSAGDVFTYNVYFDTVGGVTKIVDDVSGTSYTINNLDYNKVYYWRIVCRNKYGVEVKGFINKFKTAMAGDMDKNGIIDGDDLVPFAVSFGSTKDFKLYKTANDIDRNGRIDGADLMFLGMNFGKSY